jgi:flagellar basal-body rod protein FlgB
MPAIFGSIDTMAPAMNYHMIRQNLIASNIANADTPGYIPKELVRPEGGSGAMNTASLAMTDTRHIAGSDSMGGLPYEVHDESFNGAGNDMNRVSMELEMSRLSANTLKYQGVGKLIAKQIGILRYAANDAQRG